MINIQLSPNGFVKDGLYDQKKALEEASKKMAFKRDPESSENRKMKDIVYSEQIGGKESDADPSGTTVALVVIILIVLFIMGIALN